MHTRLSLILSSSDEGEEEKGYRRHNLRRISDFGATSSIPE